MMKYIIMCGGKYEKWKTPRQLLEYRGETIVGRTIRLLREAGVHDIFISTNNDTFQRCGVPLLKHQNGYCARKYNDVDGYWVDAFYPTDEPTCYIFGDVIFSPEAIKTIVGYEGEDIMLFGSMKPFAPEYPKNHVEPFAFKVWDTDHLKRAIEEIKRIGDTCWRSPISWDLWNVIRGRRIDIDDYREDYIAINDYTCDIDSPKDVKRMLG